MTPLVAIALALHLHVVEPERGAQTASPAPSQTPPPAVPSVPAPPPAAVALTSLDVHVVITRLIDGKPVSALPYTLAVTSDSGEAQLNMGAEVPVPSTTLAPLAPTPTPGAAAGTGEGTPTARPIATTSYRPIGTVITCRANSRDQGRYLVQLSVDDSTVFSSDSAKSSMPISTTMPVFRSFRSRNTLLLRDGESRQYTAAADRISGETVRVEVTLRVVK